jgi:multimeric flavodoxin WrbA
MSRFKIVVLNGSPKAEQSNTHIMVKAFTEGATEAGAEVENIFLAKHAIQPCVGCFKCWFTTPGHCFLTDDAEAIVDRVATANLLVFATPLYFDNISGTLKNFMDRMVMKACPTIEIDANNEARHILKNKDGQGLKIAVISNCGFPEQSQFQVLRLYFQRVARNMHAEVIAEIYRGEGPLLDIDNIFITPIVNHYKKLLRAAGKEVVLQGRLSDKLMEKLEKPLIPYDKYIKHVNEKFAELSDS